MIILILGLVIFFAVHSVRMVAGDFRGTQIAANPSRWRGIYALLSLVGFGLIIWGWWLYRAEAPEIYTPPGWGRHVASLFVLIAFVLLPAAYLPAGYIKHWLKHPMLTATILWSVGHLFANGDLASVLIFGAFLVWAVWNRIAVIGRGDPAPQVVRPPSDVVGIAIGVVVFAVFGFWLHGLLFGVSPFG